MRLSTTLIYSQGYEGIARAQSELARTQGQISSGKRITTPADDPVGAAQAQALTQASERNARLTSNVSAGTSSLESYDTYLQQVTDLLQHARTLAVSGVSASLTAADRATLAQQVQGDLADLVALANTRGADGKYVFAGFGIDAQPFTETATGASYTGDQGERTLEVAPGRTMAVTVNGSDVFMASKTGNGVVAATASASNAGSGIVGAASVVNSAATTGHTYALHFAVAAGVTTYDVLDTTAGTTVSTGNAYTPGAAITVAGVQTTISGAPANGDAFTLAPAAPQSLFATLKALVATLSTPASTTNASTVVQNGVNAALQSIDQGVNGVLAVRGSIGARLSELDTLGNALASRDQLTQKALSDIQDLDYNKAMSDYAQQQLALQAAQQSFAKVSGLSLFNYLPTG